jgi:hypothetical protein
MIVSVNLKKCYMRNLKPFLMGVILLDGIEGMVKTVNTICFLLNLYFTTFGVFHKYLTVFRIKGQNHRLEKRDIIICKTIFWRHAF